MIKKIIYSIIILLSVSVSKVFAGGTPPDIKCEGLPGCDTTSNKVIEQVASNVITEIIKYVAVFAVIALMISGIMYMISGGEEEKTKKAKTWIIYSIVAVLLSVSSWFIVNVINNFNFN